MDCFRISSPREEEELAQVDALQDPEKKQLERSLGHSVRRISYGLFVPRVPQQSQSTSPSQTGDLLLLLLHLLELILS